MYASTDEIEFSVESGSQSIQVASFAAPDHENAPSQGLQLPSLASVPLHVRCELRLPESRVRFGGGAESALWMPVPKTTVDEQRHPIFGKNDIGCPGQVFTMQAKTQSELVQQPPNDYLGPRIYSGYGAHNVAAGFGHTVLSAYDLPRAKVYVATSVPTCPFFRAELRAVQYQIEAGQTEGKAPNHDCNRKDAFGD